MTIAKVTESKKAEIIAGVDGFMVYDLKLVPYMNQVWFNQYKKYKKIQIFTIKIISQNIIIEISNNT